MACGIGAYFSLDFEPSLLWLWLAPTLSCFVFFARGHIALRPLGAACLALALGFNAAQLESHMVAAPMLTQKMEPTSITGRLMHAEILPKGKARLLIKDPVVRGLKASETPRFLRVKLKKSLGELPKSGARVNVWGPMWPPGERVAPRAYDFRRNSYFKQLGGTAVAYAGPRVRMKEAKEPAFFWDGFYLIFERARRVLLSSSYQYLTGPEAAMTATLLSGSQSSIGPEVMKAMRASGLSHLLSISGIHVSMFALLVYIPLRFLLALFPFIALRFSIKKIAAIFAIISTSLYVLLVGPETPTVRSALMTAIVLFAVIADRKSMSMRLVALASMPIMLLAPSSVIGPSFQMSFAAVLTMVAAYEKRIDQAIKDGAAYELPKWLKHLWSSGRDIILTSLIATAATTPFALFHFQSFSFYGVVANIIAIPLTSFWVMPNLLLTYLMVPFGWEAPFLAGAGWGVMLTIDLAQEIASWPFSHIDMPLMPYAAFFMSVGGGFWLCLWQKKWRYFGLLPLLGACFYPLYSAAPDVFIGAEKGIWAVRLNDKTLAVYGKKRIGFMISQWKQLANVEEVEFINKDRHSASLFLGGKYFDIEINNTKIAFLIDGVSEKTVIKICRNNDVVVTPFALQNCAAKYVIDETSLDQKGSHSISIDDGNISIETVRKQKGQRPWTLP